jgi:hypothetical protein
MNVKIGDHARIIEYALGKIVVARIREEHNYYVTYYPVTQMTDYSVILQYNHTCNFTKCQSVDDAVQRIKLDVGSTKKFNALTRSENVVMDTVRINKVPKKLIVPTCNRCVELS